MTYDVTHESHFVISFCENLNQMTVSDATLKRGRQAIKYVYMYI